MMIVLLSPAHPLRGGIAASSERLAYALQQAGHQVCIYSFSLQYPDFLFPGETQYSRDPAPADLDIRTCIHSVHPWNWVRIGRDLRVSRPDLVLARYWLPFMGPSLGTILRVARSNGHTRTMALADNILPHEKRPGDRWLTRWFLGSLDACVVMSQSVADDLRRFRPALPMALVPHPIYDNYGPALSRAESLAALSLPESPRYLLFFGLIRDYKGLDLLLEAMADERIRRRQDIRLIIAGEYYGNREKYERLVETLGLADRLVRHTYFIPTAEVNRYFGAADLVVQPYRSATQSGISQLAYHFEKPMVVTPVGGLPEIVPHGRAGYVVPPRPTAIADAILDFYENDRGAELTAGVVAGKSRFSWKAMVAGIESLYHRVSGDPAR